MKFNLNKIDHVHIYVTNRDAAEKWYSDILGLSRITELEDWAVGSGPLTIGNDDVHLALFTGSKSNSNVVAFAVELEQFSMVQQHLDENNVKYTFADHDMSVSVYFKDPYDNSYEITAYRNVK